MAPSRMRKVRRAHFVTLSTLAKEVGRSVSLVTQVENGKLKAQEALRTAICGVFKVPATALFDDAGWALR